MDIYRLIPEKQSMMKDVAEQKRKKIEQQKIIDDAIKAGPYFNKPNPQLSGAEPIVEREVAELNILESKALPAPQDSEVTDFPSEEAA